MYGTPMTNSYKGNGSEKYLSNEICMRNICIWFETYDAPSLPHPGWNMEITIVGICTKIFTWSVLATKSYKSNIEYFTDKLPVANKNGPETNNIKNSL